MTSHQPCTLSRGRGSHQPGSWLPVAQIACQRLRWPQLPTQTGESPWPGLTLLVNSVSFSEAPF